MSIYLLKILEVALTIGFIVLVHEFGHLMAARCCGVRIQRFSVFLSPLFYVVAWRPGRYLRFFINNKTHGELVEESFKYDQYHFDGIKPRSWKDTEYTLGWLPIAGYCMFDSQFVKVDPVTGQNVYPYWDVRNKNAWKRLFITISGVLANILLAVVLFSLLSFYVGTVEDFENNQEEYIVYSPYAQSVGFQNEDIILAADTFNVRNTIVDMYEIVTASSVKVLRGNDTVMIKIPQHFSDSLDAEREKKLFLSYFVCYYLNPIVSKIIPSGIADSVGIKRGDIVIKIDTTDVYSVKGYWRTLYEKRGKPISLTVLRPNFLIKDMDTLCFSFVAHSSYPGADMELAYSKADYDDIMDTFYEEDSLSHSLSSSVLDAVNATSSIFSDVASSYVNEPGNVITESGGLLSLLDIFPDSWDWWYWVYITAIFSICMAVFNMLPIPGLDGGQTIFLILEIVLRRKLNENVLGWINAIGWILILAWIVYVNVKDIIHLF